MSPLLQALLSGAAFSLLAGLLILGAGRLSERWGGPLSVTAWRMARVLVLLPLLAGPLLSQMPNVRTVEQAVLPLALEEIQEEADLVAPEVASASTVMLSTEQIAFISLAALYLAGLLTLAGQAWFRHDRRARTLAGAQAPGTLLRQVLELAAGRVGIRAPVLRVSEAVPGPVLTGWDGVILVPSELASQPEAARFALIHELVHLRRGDERDRLIGTALKTIFWFHWPLRQIEHHLDAARELACDAEVMTVLGSGARKPYAATLISMMRAGMEPASAFGADNRRQREMRIKAILSGKSFRARSTLLFLAGTSLAVSPIAVAQTLTTERVERIVPVYVRGETGDALPEHEPVVVAALADVPEAEVHPVAAPSPVAAAVATAQPVPAIAPNAEVSPTAPVVAPTFSHIAAQGRISSLYGERPSRPGGAPKFHHGVDIAAPEGTPVYAVEAGRVTHASSGYDGHSAWGNTIVVDHGDGRESFYAHLADFDVSVGDRVEAGQQIGGVGQTGRVTGPHVHVEVHLDGERVDPGLHVPGLTTRDHAHGTHSNGH